jgi:uncharacterized membrane protein YozB (DUF420 family)
MSGLLGTKAPTTSDINLLLQIIVIIILVIGIKFGKEKTPGSLKTHGRIMAIAVVLNAFAILLVMGPSLLGSFDAALGETASLGFPLTLVHHTLGLLAEVLGVLFVFKKFGKVRMWMRLITLLWLVAFVFGIFFYLTYYVI